MRISDWSSDVCSSDLDFQSRDAGAHRDMARQEAQRVDGHIFEFIGDDVACGSEGGEAGLVVPCRLAVVRGDLGRDACRIGGIDMDLVAELRGGEAKHPTELAAAQYADRRTGGEHRGSALAHEIGRASCRARVCQYV